ncbi:MAG: rod shape-determining protein MreD [Cryomorphaceae bacterium]
MNRELIAHIARFVLLLMIQVFLMNNVQFSGLINPYIYIYFLLVLPVDFSPNAGLLLAFVLGFLVDLFSQTLGMHTIASVFFAYGRPYVLRYMAPRDGYEFTRTISIRQMGWLWFLTFTGIMVFLHHFVLFFIETFRMSGLFFTLGKSISSSFFTVLLIVIIQLLFTRPPKSSLGYE